MNTDVGTRRILEYTLDELQQHAYLQIGSQLPVEYLETLSHQDKVNALQACLIVYQLTSHTIVPRVFQLRASIAMLSGNDTVITAGTGCGKTLCQLIPLLLRPDTISITISPLKRLQVTQVW